MRATAIIQNKVTGEKQALPNSVLKLGTILKLKDGTIWKVIDRY